MGSSDEEGGETRAPKGAPTRIVKDPFELIASLSDRPPPMAPAASKSEASELEPSNKVSKLKPSRPEPEAEPTAAKNNDAAPTRSEAPRPARAAFERPPASAPPKDKQKTWFAAGAIVVAATLAFLTWELVIDDDGSMTEATPEPAPDEPDLSSSQAPDELPADEPFDEGSADPLPEETLTGEPPAEETPAPEEPPAPEEITVSAELPPTGEPDLPTIDRPVDLPEVTERIARLSPGQRASAADRYRNRATAALTESDFVQARSLFRRSLAYEPDSVVGAHGMWQVHIAQNEYATAYGWIRRAIDLDADRPLLWVLLGDNLQQLRHRDEARAAWQHALEIDPEHEGARYRLAAN